MPNPWKGEEHKRMLWKGNERSHRIQKTKTEKKEKKPTLFLEWETLETELDKCKNGTEKNKCLEKQNRANPHPTQNTPNPIK